MKLNGNTLNLFQSWKEWQDLRAEHPRYIERQFILDILGITTSIYYRKRSKIRALQDEYDNWLKEQN